MTCQYVLSGRVSLRDVNFILVHGSCCSVSPGLPRKVSKGVSFDVRKDSFRLR